VQLHGAGNDLGALVLGHGAGGGVEAPDLVAATEAAVAVGVRVALVEQPYRVAGKRSQPVAAKLDEAWIAAIAALREDELADLLLIAGGRSAGARVACRTAAECGAAAVLCLAFPVHPPGKPEKSRMAELDAVALPTLVVQGESDPFGMPEGAPHRKVVTVAGNHGLKKDLDAVATAIRDWLSSTAVGAP
jgi:predicted alpha/beta-hydrolase family hydrolase